MQPDPKRFMKKEGFQVGRFGLTGTFNTILDFIAFNLSIFLFGLAAVPANLVSTTIAMAFSFIVNKTYVFGSESKKILTQAALFLIVTAFGVYIIQTGIIYLLLEIWTRPMELLSGFLLALGLGVYFSETFILVNITKVVAVAFSLTWNYLLYRTIVFNDQRSHVFDMIGDWFAENRQLVALVGIIVLAILFRFWQFGSLPPGLHPHEAADGLVAISITEGNLQPVYESAERRGGLFYLAQGLSVAILGNSMLALKVIPALLGVLAVFLTFIATKAWFKPRTALVAAFLMASLPWAVQINRMSEQPNLTLVLLPLLLWSVTQAIRSNKAVWYVISGIITGLLFYTSVPLYAWLALIAAMATYGWYFYRNYLSQNLQPILIISLSAALTVLPMMIHSALNKGLTPFTLWAQELFASLQTPLDTAQELFVNAVRTLGMFHFRGDMNPLYNLSGVPQLNAFIGILFILGLILAIKRWRDLRYFTLLAVLAAMLLPGIFQSAVAPSAVWTVAAVPVVCMLAAVGLIELYARWRGVFPHNVFAFQLALIIMVSALSMSTVYNWRQYFVAWAQTPEAYIAHHEAAYQLGTYISDIDNDEATIYVVAPGDNTLPVRYLAHSNVNYVFVDIEDVTRVRLRGEDQLLILSTSQTEDIAFDFPSREVYSPDRTQTVLFTVYSTQ